MSLNSIIDNDIVLPSQNFSFPVFLLIVPKFRQRAREIEAIQSSKEALTRDRWDTMANNRRKFV